jgi:hypothetical protein
MLEFGSYPPVNTTTMKLCYQFCSMCSFLSTSCTRYILKYEDEDTHGDFIHKDYDVDYTSL